MNHIFKTSVLLIGDNKMYNKLNWLCKQADQPFLYLIE